MKSTITNAVTEVLTDLGLNDINFTVEHPTDLAHGDYATNVALVAMQSIREVYKSTEDLPEGLIFKNPQDLAETLRERLEKKIEGVEKIEVAGPGFINFFLTRVFFKEKIAFIQKEKLHWGANDSWGGKKVAIEYTDPNPFKEFHVGHLFTNSVGESLSRLFEASGAEVKRFNYQGDVGLHVACAVFGMQELGFAGTRDFTAQELGKAYTLGATKYKEDESVKETVHYINKSIYERSDPVINELYDKGREVSLAYFEKLYVILDTSFDHYFFESEAGPKGKALVLQNPEIFKESDGARIFAGEEYGLHTRVFLNSEGLPTYEAKELALAKMKEEVFSYDHSIISTANEVSEYFKVLKKAMSFVYPELEKKTEHIGHGTVRLSSGKMSSRTGDVIPALTFVDEIGSAVREKMQQANAESDPDPELVRDIALGAIKYATLKSNIFQDTVFNKEQALSFEGDSGPYLMYTHARIVSVLEKAKGLGVEASPDAAPEGVYPVEKLLYRLPDVVKEATAERTPHLLATYLVELAGAFNTFYAHEKIADATDKHAPYKAAVADAVRITLENGLWGLGIKAPERM